MSKRTCAIVSLLFVSAPISAQPVARPAIAEQLATPDEIVDAVDRCIDFDRNPVNGKSRLLALGWSDLSSESFVGDSLKGRSDAGVVRKRAIMITFASGITNKARGPGDVCYFAAVTEHRLEDVAKVVAAHLKQPLRKRKNEPVFLVRLPDVLIAMEQPAAKGLRVTVLDAVLGK